MFMQNLKIADLGQKNGRNCWLRFILVNLVNLKHERKKYLCNYSLQNFKGIHGFDYH